MSDATSGPPPEILTDAVTAGPATTVLPAAATGAVPGHRAGRPRRRGRVIGAAVVGAALVCGAGFAAARALSGGGTQPEDVLPAGVVAYADIDLDPAAGQKVNAVRFLRRLPQLDRATGGSDDLRTMLLDGVLGRSGIDASQVAPWLGERAGVAAVRDGTDLQVVAAVQTTDPEQAQATLSRLLGGGSGSGPGTAVSGDYVVIAATTAEAQRVVALGEQRPLSSDPAFTAALAGFGDGVASFYVDGAALGSVTSVAGQPVPAGQLSQLAATGTAAGIVRFDPDAVELLAEASGGTTRAAVADEPTGLVSTLPDTTVLALGSASGGSEVAAGVGRLLERLDTVTGMDTAAMVQRRFGLRLPGDAATFLGTDRVLAVDAGSSTSGGPTMPSIGYRSVTDPNAAAGLVRRLDPLVRQLTGGFGLVTRPTSDGLVVATTPRYAATLSTGDGSLGTTAVFRDAVPESSGAGAVGFLDLDRLATLLHTMSPQADTSALDPLRAVGLSVRVDGGTAQYRVRLTLG